MDEMPPHGGKPYAPSLRPPGTDEAGGTYLRSRGTRYGSFLHTVALFTDMCTRKNCQLPMLRRQEKGAPQPVRVAIALHKVLYGGQAPSLPVRSQFAGLKTPLTL